MGLTLQFVPYGYIEVLDSKGIPRTSDNVGLE